MLAGWRDALGLLSVALAVLAAVVYIAQTLRGEVRPHPLSWFLFGILSLTGYWVQRDQGARQGSWTLLAMTLICFLFVAVSVARGGQIATGSIICGAPRKTSTKFETL